jgi:hypothetical protein
MSDLERIRAKAERENRVDEFNADFDTACKKGLYGKGFMWLWRKWMAVTIMPHYL